MKARIVFEFSGKSEKAINSILEIRDGIQSGEFQRNIARESKVDDPYMRVKATFEMLEE